MKASITDILKYNGDNEVKFPLFIFVNKGIEAHTNAITLEIVADTLGKEIARVASFLVSSQTVYQ